MASTDEIFRDLISLVGKSIDVGLHSTGERLSGTIAYTMFDSFILIVNGAKRIIPFNDILFLDPKD